MQPDLPGIAYDRPDGTSGYSIGFDDPNNTGNPQVANPNGSQIAAGPYAGLVGLITPYRIEVTARTAGNAEVKMRREFQTVAIPVFQFGLFSENDLSFFAGPNFSFGGKVHTNQNLYLKQDSGGTLTLQDRVTAVGEVVRQRLANGVVSHTGDVRMARATGCPAAPTAINGNCFLLGLAQGSVTDSVPPATAANPNPNWATISMGSTNGWLRNGRTGARRLDLPVVSDGALPVDLIRRPPAGEDPNGAIGQQRFYNLATLRILLSDEASDLTGLPDAVFTAGQTPVRLAGLFTPVATDGGQPTAPAQPFATVPGSASATLRDQGYRTTAGTALLDGYILINRQDRDGNWTDVTREILSLGFSGRRLSNGTIDVANLNNNCEDVHPNAVIRLQRYADTKTDASGGCPAFGSTPVASTAVGDYWPNVLYDAREGFLRDDQTAAGRPTAPVTFGAGASTVTAGQPRMPWGGVMHYVELDVRNFRRWIRDEIGSSNSAACLNGAGGGTCPMDVTGYVVYFSDRRGNRNLGGDGAPETGGYTAGGGPFTGGWDYNDDAETAELGFEDIINPESATSVPNANLDGTFTDTLIQTRNAEDVNARDDLPKGCHLPDNPPCTDVYVQTLETYGGTARLLPGFMISSSLGGVTNRTPAADDYQLYLPSNRPIDRNVARVNRAFFFRRALKLVNGGRGDLPANRSQGLTVTSENPVYVQGNYNACVTSTTRPNQGNNFNPACTGGVGFGNVPGTDHVSAAIIADAVTLLSNGWNDIRSFVNPWNAGLSGLNTQDAQGKYNARQASPTWYRAAIIAGKGINFQRPTSNTTVDHQDFGTDGGAHNFLRYLENWSGVALNYRGSLISFYTSRQAVGTYKCCDVVYGAPSRGYNFDTDFLLPPLLPPRTPMFRDLNTLTFRQILRPTQ
jgi:hypothetical protein